MLLTPNGRNQYFLDKLSPIVVYWNKQLLLIVASPQTVLWFRIYFFSQLDNTVMKIIVINSIPKFLFIIRNF